MAASHEACTIGLLEYKDIMNYLRYPPFFTLINKVLVVFGLSVLRTIE